MIPPIPGQQVKLHCSPPPITCNFFLWSPLYTSHVLPCSVPVHARIRFTAADRTLWETFAHWGDPVHSPFLFSLWHPDKSSFPTGLSSAIFFPTSPSVAVCPSVTASIPVPLPHILIFVLFTVSKVHCAVQFSGFWCTRVPPRCRFRTVPPASTPACAPCRPPCGHPTPTLQPLPHNHPTPNLTPAVTQPPPLQSSHPHPCSHPNPIPAVTPPPPLPHR